MVSIPKANRSSVSGEKTAMRSCSVGGRRAATHKALSRPASDAIVSQRSAVEVCNRLDRPVDLVVAVRERDEHRLELARRDVDLLFDQMSKERGIAFGVAALRIVEIEHGLIRHEERRHRTDALDTAV